jgi:uncharacterized protein YfiM (DUF2279 family)
LILKVRYFISLLVLALVVLSIESLNAQNADTSSVSRKRLQRVLIAETSIYGATMLGLNQLWYKDYPREHFHFFNDNKEWLQIDKVGHSFSAYYLGLVGMEALHWSGVSKTKSTWIGGALGLVFLSSIEVFDGFSQGWGFSNGDMIANASGYLLAAGQQQLFNKQIAMLKVSFQASPYAQARPNVLGSGFSERIMKDYNGQTYWLSFAIADILPFGEKFPPWLALAFGYGAKGMYGGFDNVWESKGATYDFTSTKREREFYAAIDINLWRIKTKNKTLQSIFKTIGFLKVPLPAYEFKTKRFYPFYF